MPLTSPEPQSKTNATKKNMNIIQDQDVNFIFRFHSCTKCEYTELYLTHNKGKRIYKRNKQATDCAQGVAYYLMSKSANIYIKRSRFIIIIIIQ
jgi:predicted nucleic-acid-binding Zn-ribbon protein